jgi:hypothetical protein
VRISFVLSWNKDAGGIDTTLSEHSGSLSEEWLEGVRAIQPGMETTFSGGAIIPYLLAVTRSCDKIHERKMSRRFLCAPGLRYFDEMRALE